MHIQTINYTRTFNLGNYSSEKIGVEFALNEGESATKALDYARELVEEYHKQNVIKLKEFQTKPEAKALFAIDINSKFESLPGIKDTELIKNFINQL